MRELGRKSLFEHIVEKTVWLILVATVTGTYRRLGRVESGIENIKTAVAVHDEQLRESKEAFRAHLESSEKVREKFENWLLALERRPICKGGS